MITVKNLTKEFQLKQKQAGLVGSLKSLINPTYQLVKAVDNISFHIDPGEVVGFIGPNGAGKSTTIIMLSGILFPTSGDIKVMGFNPQKQRKKLAFHIGTIFGQKPQLWYHLPALDTYNLLSKIYELNPKKYQSRLSYLVKLFEVEEIVKQPVRKLSLGQRMRCELIGSLLHSPQLIFLDEPTIGLDLIAKKKIRELLTSLNKKEKVTILLTSHDMEDVEQTCHRLVIINQGEIVYDGSTAAIREKYLQYKVINVTFEEPVKSIPGVTIISKDKYSYSLKIDSSNRSISTVVQMLVTKYKVADISIADPPIEEIIERIFKNESSQIY